MPLSSPTIERCRPALGTFARISVRGVPADVAHAAIDAAFEEIAVVHRLMSFHEADSDVSRLNREAHCGAVSVDFRTFEVLTQAQEMSAMSGGAFDITVAPVLVRRGALPEPCGAPAVDPDADWRDVELLADGRVRFRKPLWIDLGGIAKGYAVDRAIAALARFGPAPACVNAGGDLRVCGKGRIALDAGDGNAFVDLENGALASSSGFVTGRTDHGEGMHIDPAGDCAARRFASVAAPSCIDADALTKIVMARGAASAEALSRCGATAYTFDEAIGWQRIPGLRRCA
jgi:thiamine biosynthesis lipoprotein